MANSRSIIGVMSGSSLDGLDLALCRFSQQNHALEWEVLATGQAHYDPLWLERLSEVRQVDQTTFFTWNYEYGVLLGQAIAHFAIPFKNEVDLAVVHGHTVIHDPKAHFSVQLGHGAAISAQCAIPVLCDVRSADMALGGQGAPLAHLADLYLFPGFAAYLNLGGIANITIPSVGRAWDLCGANQLLNGLAHLAGKPYDDRGQLAASGKVIPILLQKLNADPYLQMGPPKSLDNRYVQTHFTDILLADEHPLPDRLATACEHVARMVVDALIRFAPREGRILLSGGGAYNEYLVSRFSALAQEAGIAWQWIVPEAQILEYKEALLMALMGYLHLEQKANCLPSYTGASGPSLNGALYQTHPTA